jgi:hypothetical protein
MALLFLLVSCYVSSFFETCSEVVISFFNKGKSISPGCLFCISVRNRIYVLEVEMLEPVVLARKHKFGKAPILMLDCMIS